MSEPRGTRRTCSRGHVYHKRSDCQTCPRCEAERKPAEAFLILLVGPARRALERAGIMSLDALARHSEAEILQLHGVGPSSLPRLRQALCERGLAFRAD